MILKCIHVSKKKCKDIVQKLPITWGNPKQNFRWSYFAHYCNNKKKCAEKNFTHKRTFTQKEVKAIYLASIQTYSRQFWREVDDKYQRYICICLLSRNLIYEKIHKMHLKSPCYAIKSKSSFNNFGFECIPILSI